MRDLKWMETDACKKMMEEDWFDHKKVFANAYDIKLRTERYRYGGVDKPGCMAVYFPWPVDTSDDTKPLHVPLEMHAAWVLQRAEEEMWDRIVVRWSPEDNRWYFWDVQDGKWIRDKEDLDGGALYFDSRPAAVLAAYEYLYPGKVAKAECDPDTEAERAHKNDMDAKRIVATTYTDLEERLGRLELVLSDVMDYVYADLAERSQHIDDMIRLLRKSAEHPQRKGGGGNMSAAEYLCTKLEYPGGKQEKPEEPQDVKEEQMAGAIGRFFPGYPEGHYGTVAKNLIALYFPKPNLEEKSDEQG